MSMRGSVSYTCVSVLFTAGIQFVAWQGTCWTWLGMLILAWCAGRWRGHLFQLWQHIKRDWDDIHIHHISGTQFEWNESGGPMMRFLLWLELHDMASLFFAIIWQYSIRGVELDLMIIKQLSVLAMWLKAH